MKISFTVTVEAPAAEITKHLGQQASAELHAGGAVYLNDLIPEFEYESGPIETVENEDD